MGEFNFKKFTSVGGKFVISITLAKPGGLSMSSGFYSKYKIEEYNAIQLYFDESKNVIAVQFLKDSAEGALKIKHRDKSKGGYASAISFIKSYGLEKYLGKKITPEVYEDEELGKLFLLKLDKE